MNEILSINLHEFGNIALTKALPKALVKQLTKEAQVVAKFTQQQLKFEHSKKLTEVLTLAIIYIFLEDSKVIDFEKTKIDENLKIIIDTTAPILRGEI